MKYRIIKIIKAVLFFIGIVVLATCLIQELNEIIFKYSIKSKFENAYWQGDWQSAEISLVNGKMIANLPKNPPPDTPLSIDVLVYYNIWSFYNIGGTREFKMVGIFGNENITNGITRSLENHQTSGSFSFKAKATGGFGQEIEYNGVVSFKRNKIAGGYKSSYPNDVGTFVLKRD